MTRSLLVLVALLVAAGCEDPGPADEQGCPALAGEGEVHGANVEEDATWSAGLHRVERTVRVRSGATLTLAPCAVVQLAADASLLVEDGTLEAEGTAERPIRLEAAGAEPFGHLLVQHPGTARLAHVTVEGGGADRFRAHAAVVVWGDGEAPLKPVLHARHLTIRGSVGHGLLLEREGTLAPGSEGLTIEDGGAEAIRVQPLAVSDLPDVALAGNARDEILVTHGALHEDRTFRDLGAPYRIGESPDSYLWVRPPTHPGPKVTLTLEAGVELRFSQGSALIVGVTGSAVDPAGLVAQGTAERPVVFTSGADEPQAGDWQGILFNHSDAATDNLLEHVVVAYAGGECLCTYNTCVAGAQANESEGAIRIVRWIPESSFFRAVQLVESASHGVVRGWSADTGASFVDDVTAEGLAGCVETSHKDSSNSCLDLDTCG